VVIENSQTNIVLSDSRKTTYSSLVCYADWEEIDYLITDSGMDQEVVRELSEHTEVIQVEQAGTGFPLNPSLKSRLSNSRFPKDFFIANHL